MYSVSAVQKILAQGASHTEAQVDLSAVSVKLPVQGVTRAALMEYVMFEISSTE